MFPHSNSYDFQDRWTPVETATSVSGPRPPRVAIGSPATPLAHLRSTDALYRLLATSTVEHMLGYDVLTPQSLADSMKGHSV
ncbi:hypothetical protein BD413DRAFT_561053 [Trametes elegans]|nr:hypothetical protein BD413DRAFT_561053 [Trametes elegans]